MQTRLDPTSRFKGTVTAKDDLLIEGVVVGGVHSSARIVVAQGARVQGPVSGREVEVAGTVDGDVRAQGRLHLAATGKIHGDVQAAHLTVEDGGVLHGKVLADVSEEIPPRA